MLRRELLRVAGAAALAGNTAPNILFLLSDQFRADALGASGNTFVHTPNLDRLAGSGVRFSNAYCPQALCTPSRGALLTGVYPHTNRLDRNLYKVRNAFSEPEFKLEPNWPALLRNAGYYTGYIGKWHLGEDDPKLFDYWNGFNSLLPHWLGKPYESRYRSDVEAEDAMDFLERNARRRFLLMLSFYPPHTPYTPPRRFQELYAGRQVEHMMYYAACSAVDWNVGRVLERLDSLGLARNTMVVFTSDHGETFGKRMGSRNKTVCYEESARVPLLIRWPGRLPAGLEFRGGATTLDLMPTLLEAAGVARPVRLEGRSRLRAMERRQTGWSEPVFLENITQNPVEGEVLIERAVRSERWKLILRRRPKNELYDLREDPGEQRDLFGSPEHAPVVRQHARWMMNWGRRTGDEVSVELAGRLV